MSTDHLLLLVKLNYSEHMVESDRDECMNIMIIASSEFSK